MKVAIFDTHNFERPYLEQANQGQLNLNYFDVRLDLSTAELARDRDAVCIFGNDDASAEVINELARLNVKYIALRSAGYNHVDLERAAALGISVANVPAYSPYAVAEHTVALMLALNRKLIRAHNRIMELNFSLDGLVGFDMNGKTVGIVGVGKIGAVLAKILNGFGCRLLGYDLVHDQHAIDRYGLKYVSLDELCSESDIISLHVPLNKETRYIIDEKRIAKMKPGVMLINTSRGGLLNTKDVITGLKRKHIGSLGLDVYEEEKGVFFHDHSAEDMLEDDVISRLMTFRNVLITSHQAFLTDTALKNIADTTMANLLAWKNGTKAEFELTISQ